MLYINFFRLRKDLYEHAVIGRSMKLKRVCNDIQLDLDNVGKPESMF